ncbi:amidase domain-containing protein [Subtercola sp. PAMC28395]|uniref:IPT/TIG domain-containing protein n=1 Tax=Subtercola sp. PAMC28395 TaxID=2846775 RepID=UPI001C0CC3FB|nr:amidase domain-containing protein [Subtercola sp. PAMC28395]QWT24567.1 amidase domain-containing protein [Subtercola sp. PAMC28395]
MPSRRALLLFAGGASLTAIVGGVALRATAEDANVPATPSPSPTPVPEVTRASVASGSLLGGTALALTGTGLGKTVSVLIGGVPAESFSVTDDQTISVVTPAAADYQPATVSITLGQSDGTTRAAAPQFSYQAISTVDRQLQYAFTYWQNYNLAEWGRFPDNDCGNIVNQTLLARGWEQNDDWYSDYATTGDYSYSWIRGNEMDDYLASRPDTTRLELSDRAKVKVGDVVMFDWDPQNGNGVDHTMLVSKVLTNADGSTSIKLVGHTLDAQFRDLDEAITVSNPGGTAHFFSIAD